MFYSAVIVLTVVGVLLSTAMSLNKYEINADDDRPAPIIRSKPVKKQPHGNQSVPDKPEGPLNVSDIQKNGCMLKWNKPSYDGGKPIKRYLVEKCDNKTDNCTFVGNTSRHVTEKRVTQLISGQEYKFRVYAVNEVGKSEPLDTEHAIRTLTKPGTPVGPIIISDTHEHGGTLKWNKPLDDGGKPIKKYLVKKFDYKTNKWVSVGKTNSNMTEFKVDGLASYKQHQFLVKALNGVGESEGTIGNVLLTKPGKPKGQKSFDIDGNSCTFKWNKSQDNSIPQADKYFLEIMDNITGIWVPVAGNTLGNVTEMKVELKYGQSYKFRVRGWNKLGYSEYSETSQEWTPINYTVPDKPEGPLRVNCKKNCTLNWKMPKKDGGKPISAYIVDMEDTDIGDWEDNKTSTNVTYAMVDGVKPRHKYMFRVKAVNELGPSEYLKTTRKTKIPSIPDKPEDLDVSKIHKDGFTLRWMRPRKYGGKPIITYFLLVIDKFDTETGNWDLTNPKSIGKSLHIQLKGLIPGHEYQFRMKAVNILGESEPLEMNSTRLPTVPGKPEGPIKVSNYHQKGCTLTWNKPKDDGGKPIKAYLVEKFDTEIGDWAFDGKTFGNLLEKKVDGLIPGHEYKFRVKAVNEVGESETLEFSKPEKPEVFWYQQVVEVWGLELEVWQLIFTVIVILIVIVVVS